MYMNGKDKQAQLLLLAIAILAIALILIAASSIVVLNIKRELTQEVIENLGNEFKELKLNFGYALEDELSNRNNRLNFTKMTVNDTNNITVKKEINESLENVSSQFEYFQALKGRIFNASFTNSFQADDSYKNISFNVSFILKAQELEFEEEVRYEFEYNATADRYEVRFD